MQNYTVFSDKFLVCAGAMPFPGSFRPLPGSCAFKLKSAMIVSTIVFLDGPAALVVGRPPSQARPGVRPP